MSASDRGINPNALHRLGFMPRKHLNHTKQNSLSTGSGESFIFSIFLIADFRVIPPPTPA